MSQIFCEGCGNPIEHCDCRCPYCDETILCKCCIGPNTCTGG